MRTLFELYSLLYVHMKATGQKVEPQQSLVWLVSNNKVTGEEFREIMMDLRRNKPTKKLHSKFYNHPTFSRNDKKQDWWNNIDKDVRRQMRLFIKKMIRINRNGKSN